MKFEKPISIEELKNLVQPKKILVGKDAPSQILGINEIHNVSVGDIAFVDNEKYYTKTIASYATFILIDKEVECPPNKVLVVVDHPFHAYQTIVLHVTKPPYHGDQEANPTSAKVGLRTQIAPSAFVSHRASIGNDCIIFPNVTILDNVIIGDRVIIQSGTVIGGDAFYYHRDPTSRPFLTKMTSCGSVVIEDDVEIGSCCTIDRGVTGTTSIGRGTKLDNQIHIAHEVRIGRDCIIAAHAAIAGNSSVGDDVVILGKVGVTSNVHIASGAYILSGSGVAKDIVEKGTYWGTPATNATRQKRELVWISRIEEIWNKLTDIEKRLP